MSVRPVRRAPGAGVRRDDPLKWAGMSQKLVRLLSNANSAGNDFGGRPPTGKWFLNGRNQSILSARRDRFELPLEKASFGGDRTALNRDGPPGRGRVKRVA